jgi:hypothetical protein
MNEVQARLIAENHVEAINMRGYRAVFVQAHKVDRRSQQWSVVFELYSPDGFVVDGPMIVDVDEITGTAKTFSSL